MISGFSRKIICSPYWKKGVQNGVFLSFLPIKLCHYFLLEVVYNERPYNPLLPCGNPQLGKFCSTSYRSICSSNQIAGFSDRHLWDGCVDIPDPLYGYIGQREVVYGASTFGWVCPDMVSHSQTCLDLPRARFGSLQG